MTERMVNGLFVRERGQGAPVVLLHGFPQTGECWNGVADRLAGRNRVLIPDLPGYGKSARPASSDAGTVARVILQAMEEAGADKFALVGHDWGGSIAFRIALEAPERVEKLVVVNAPFRHLDLRHGWHMLALNLPVLPEAAFVLGGRWVVPWMLRAGAANKDAFNADAVRGYVESLGDVAHARSTLAYYRTITRSLLRKSLSSLPIPGRSRPAPRTPRPIEVPTMLVWGMRDPAMPPSLIPTITRDIPNCKVVEIEEAGHFVPEEASERLAHEIDHFLVSG